MKNISKIKEIVSLLQAAPNDAMRLELLDLLFTPSELNQLIARYNIVKGLLSKKQTQRELASSLKLSIAKITRGSHALKRRSDELMAYLTAFLANESL